MEHMYIQVMAISEHYSRFLQSACKVAVDVQAVLKCLLHVRWASSHARGSARVVTC
jgi:hypothetical protein